MLGLSITRIPRRHMHSRPIGTMNVAGIKPSACQPKLALHIAGALYGTPRVHSNRSGKGFKTPFQPITHKSHSGRQGSSRRAGLVAMAAAQSDKKTKVLFVCLGNICRSPTAEAVFKKVVEDAGVANKFDIDSCGTGGGSPDWYMEGGFSYHEGDESDPRMTRAASARGVRLTSRSRPLKPSDLSEFDYILGMDASNIAAIKRAAKYWAGKHALPENYEAKIGLMTDHITSPKFKRYEQVPDPYYGGSSGFELVLDLLDDACSGLLANIQKQRGQ